MNYDVNSIETLTFKEGCRRRINMYLGSADIEGTYQALKEIINNSTDECYMGYGNRIEVELKDNNTVSIRDYGRGVPFGINDEGQNVLVLIYSTPHSGGKFNEKVYKSVSGLNGVGGSCVCQSSINFVVRSYRDKVMAEAVFKQGDLISYIEKPTKEKTGTYIEFAPDPEVFHDGNIGYSYERICKDVQRISYLCNGVEFNIKCGDKNTKYLAKNGIKDFIKDNLSTPLTKNIMYKKVEQNGDSLEIAYQWGSKNETSYVFVNGLHCVEGGVPVTGARTAITRTINSLIGKTINGELIRKNLFYVINCKISNPSFANQTKTKINNEILRKMASDAFTESLKEFSLKYKSDYDTLVTYLKKLDKAEAAAEKTRQSIINHEKEFTENSKKPILNADQLKDARQLGQDSILLCVEGDSAGGSMAQGRDPNKYGILILKGKIKNLLKSPIEEGLENMEIKLLLQGLGLVYGKTYNGNKLRYGKVAIAVDADPDGHNIALLIMAALQVLCPQLLEENRLYWLKAPIAKVSTKSKAYYYYSLDEMNGHPNGEIIYYKGLGQLDEQDLKNSMFSPTEQRLEQINYSPDGINLLLQLMGSDIQSRKDFVTENIDFDTIIIE